MKESFTAAIVVRSLWAALGVVWVVGLLVGWVVGRLVVCWPVSWDVVVAVVIVTCELLEGWMGGPAAKTADRLVAARAWKIPLAGDGFGALRSPISHRGDHGAAYHEEPESGGENPGRTGGLLSGTGVGPRGVPHR